MMDIKYSKMDDKGVHQTLGDTAVAVQITFLRIHLHCQHREGAHEANWEAIDTHLDKIRKRSSNYQAA